MLQIGTEAALRGLVGGVLDPRNLIAGRQLMHHLETTPEGRAALAEMVNAVFYNQHTTLGVHYDANRATAVAKAVPPVKLLLAAHRNYADAIGATMTNFEHQFRLMGLGKISRQQVQEFTRSYQAGIHLQGQNVAMLASKLQTDPLLVAKFGRQIDDIFGKYNKFSPGVRAAVQSVTPFLPWYLNAARFVLWHLPVKSPLSSSLMATLRQTMYQDVQDGKKLPLDPFAAEQLARLTPMGILAYPTSPGVSAVGAILSKDVAGMVLPQIEGSFYNLAGVNSFGSGPLKGPGGNVKPGSGAAVRTAVEGGAETLFPGLRLAREALEGTKSSYGTSTIVQPQGKGDKMGAGILSRLFNPFYSFEQAQQRAGSTGGSGGGGIGVLPGSGSGGGGVLPGPGSAGGGVLP